MKKVLATGVFDILHPGHIFYLNQAKALGDFLIVLITSDSVATKQKGKPTFSQEERAELIKNLVMVDRVVIGDKILDECQTLLKIKPNIIALGYDQSFSLDQLENCQWKGKVVRINKYPNKDRSTTNIKRTIIKNQKLIRKGA